MVLASRAFFVFTLLTDTFLFDSTSATYRWSQIDCIVNFNQELTVPHSPSQGKRRGDPGTDPSTVEPVSHLRSRLFSFWDSLFPASSSPPISSSDEPTQKILYVSHGAAIREFIQALIHERGGDYSLMDLPEGEEEMLRRGEKRIGNCARTLIEMTPRRREGEHPLYHSNAMRRQ